jgi:hypothetical protein
MDHMGLADPPEQVRAFVRDGRITGYPKKPERRMVLLEQVAMEFEPGRYFDERQVDTVLKEVADDHATLRRYLVDHELMSRTPSGIYWRTGGPVPVS